MSGLLKLIQDNGEFCTLILAAGGGSFARWRWMVDQKWRRIQYAQSLVRDFLAKNTTNNALEILDVLNETVDLHISESETTKVKITDQLLIDALAPNFNSDKRDEKILLVRRTLDEFLGDLSLFQNHIDAGLIKLKDVRPYLTYWVKELTGTGRIHKNPALGRQVVVYCRKFGYDPLLELGMHLGAPFPDKDA